MTLATVAISVPGRGRVELGLLKRMCTSAAQLLLVVAVFSVGLHSVATGTDSTSLLGLTESFEMRRLPLLSVGGTDGVDAVAANGALQQGCHHRLMPAAAYADAQSCVAHRQRQCVALHSRRWARPKHAHHRWVA
jgi:hypothetical protein